MDAHTPSSAGVQDPRLGVLVNAQLMAVAASDGVHLREGGTELLVTLCCGLVAVAMHDRHPSAGELQNGVPRQMLQHVALVIRPRLRAVHIAANSDHLLLRLHSAEHVCPANITGMHRHIAARDTLGEAGVEEAVGIGDDTDLHSVSCPAPDGRRSGGTKRLIDRPAQPRVILGNRELRELLGDCRRRSEEYALIGGAEHTGIVIGVPGGGHLKIEAA